MEDATSASDSPILYAHAFVAFACATDVRDLVADRARHALHDGRGGVRRIDQKGGLP